MRSIRSERRRADAGYFTLIGLLIVIVIIAILFVVFMGGGGSPTTGGQPASTIGGAKDRAQDVLCRNNLQQLRYAISIHQSSSGAYPPSLNELQSPVALNCPVGGEPYEYDAGSGQVRCPHPGHGEF